MIKKTPVSILCALLAGSAAISTTQAGNMGSSVTSVTSATSVTSGGSVEGIAEREIVRRQESIAQAQTFIEAGRRAMSDKDYEEACTQFIGAVKATPQAEAASDVRNDAVNGFIRAHLKLAEQRIAEGRYGDAKALCDRILDGDSEYNWEGDPKNGGALSLMAKLEDPEYYNQTITPGFVAKVEDVKKLLLDADGFAKTGRYDMAMKRYDQVLNVDPYNKAARKGQEEVNRERSNYGMEGYNEARSRAIWQVDQAWASPVRKFQTRETNVYDQNKTDVRGTAAVEKKLTQIIINKIDLKTPRCGRRSTS